MRAFRLIVAAGLMSCLVPATAAAAAAGVSVTYANPDRFTDAADESSDPRDVAASLARHLTALGQRYLGADDDLRISILDVDRAGSPRRNLPTEIRVVRGDSDFPCIDLAFDLTSSGRTYAFGRERVCERNYLTFRRADLRYSPNDPLGYG